MQLEGIVNIGRNKGTLVIRRQGAPNGRIVFHFEALESLDDFEKLCPIPQPREVIKPGGERVYAVEDPAYKKAITKHFAKRQMFIFLKSLVATEPAGLKWEMVDMNDSDTWENFETELAEFGLNFAEITRLRHTALEVNSMSDSAFDEALEDFLAGKPDRATALSNAVEPVSTVSSESVSDSDTDPQGSPKPGIE